MGGVVTAELNFWTVLIPQLNQNNLCNLCSKPTTSCFLSKIFGPGGTKVNSRGRAALREAHGSMKQGLKTLKGSDNEAGSTPSGSDDVTD